MKKRIIAVLMVAALALGTFSTAFATTKDNAENKKKQAQSNLDDVNSQMKDIESQQKKLQSQMDDVSSQLVDLLVSIDVLKDEKEQKQAEYKKVKADLKTAKKNEQEQYDAMKLRIQYMYENSDTSFFEVLLESKSIADMLNQIEYYDSVYSYDKDMLDAYQAAKEKTAKLKKETEEALSDLDEIEEQYAEQQKELESTMATLKKQNSDFATKLASAQDLASQYKKTIVAQNAVIKEQEAIQKQQEEEAKRQQQEANNNSNNNSNNDSSGSDSGSSDSGSGGSDSSESGENPSYSTNVSGSEVVAYAMQFVGKPYVWGGTDPNTGADCSGFTQYVMKHFGIYIPRTSSEQRYAGKEVSYSNAQPGDLICYAGHVALYIGGGQIVHARGRAYGICVSSNAAYRTILSVRRVL